jgi:ABC-2 type transport system permease protein
VRYEAQTVAYHEAWKAFFFPRIDARDALTPPEFDRIPAFAWQEEPAGLMRGQAALAVLQLLVPSLLLFGLAAWRLRRFSVA